MKGVHCLIVCHVSGCGTEFSVSLNHFVDSFQKVFFSCHFPSCSDGKHSSFCAYTSNFRTCENDKHSKIGIVSNKTSVFWQQSITDGISQPIMHKYSVHITKTYHNTCSSESMKIWVDVLESYFLYMLPKNFQFIEKNFSKFCTCFFNFLTQTVFFFLQFQFCR